MITDDPGERNDLAKEMPDLVRKMHSRFMSYKNRYVDPDIQVDDPKGSPRKWNHTVTPGWC